MNLNPLHKNEFYRSNHTYKANKSKKNPECSFIEYFVKLKIFSVLKTDHNDESNKK